MPIDTSLLSQKAYQTIAALETSTPKEREKPPSEGFGRDYNAFRALVLESRPDLASVMPPEVAFVQGGPAIRYIELLAYYKKIYGFIYQSGYA
jgi:hypothetical protein